MEKKTTPERITELKPNEIFVFGSNLEGMHGGEADYRRLLREEEQDPHHDDPLRREPAKMYY